MPGPLPTAKPLDDFIPRSGGDSYPDAPKPGTKLVRPFCSALWRCDMLGLAVAGTRGSDVGLQETWVLNQKPGYQTRLGYTVRVKTNGRKGSRKFLTLFFSHCPFCGRRVRDGAQ